MGYDLEKHLPLRTFIGEEGKKSEGVYGPNAIKDDIESMIKMFKPDEILDENILCSSACDTYENCINKTPQQTCYKCYGGIHTLNISNNAITMEKISENAVSAEKISDDAIIQIKIAVKAVATDKIADSAITNIKLGVNAVITEKIADANVTTDKIANSNVTTAKINDLAVTTDKINDLSVTESKIGAGAVTANKLGSSSVQNSKLATDSISTSKILNSAVTAVKLAADAVETLKIKDANITASKLAANSVETAKIKDLNVTTGKINDLAVTTAKINAKAVTGAKIADATITDVQLANDAVLEAKLAADAVTEIKIKDYAVTRNKIGTNAVTLSKLGTDFSVINFFDIEDIDTMITKGNYLSDDGTILKVSEVDGIVTQFIINGDGLSTRQGALNSENVFQWFTEKLKVLNESDLTGDFVKTVTLEDLDVTTNEGFYKISNGSNVTVCKYEYTSDGENPTTYYIYSQFIFYNADAEDENANKLMFRTRIAGGAWSEWVKYLTSDLLGIANGIATINESGKLEQMPTSADVGLGNVDNTSDVNKPISTATQTALNLKLAAPTKTVYTVDNAYPVGTVALSNSDKKTFALTNHGFTANKILEFSDGTGALPTGFEKVALWDNRAYVYVHTVVDVNTFTVKKLRADTTELTFTDIGTTGYLVRLGSVSSIVQALSITQDATLSVVGRCMYQQVSGSSLLSGVRLYTSNYGTYYTDALSTIADAQTYFVGTNGFAVDTYKYLRAYYTYSMKKIEAQNYFFTASTGLYKSNNYYWSSPAVNSGVAQGRGVLTSPTITQLTLLSDKAEFLNGTKILTEYL